MMLISIYVFLLLLGSTLAKDQFFKNVKRAELFEKTDFKVPTISVTLSDEDLALFKLNYQCQYDTSIRNKIRNEECYNAPWVNVTYAVEKAFQYKVLTKTEMENDDLKLLQSSEASWKDFEKIIKKYTKLTLEDVFSPNYGLVVIPNFEAEGSLKFELDGETITKPKIKFSVGGQYTKYFEKLGYNIKIKGDTLLGRKQLRLRSEVVDPSFLREKIGYDICNVLELPSLSLNYCFLIVNGEKMGFYAMRDAFKAQWIEDKYGEKDTPNLYECHQKFGNSKIMNCQNTDETIKNDDFKNFLRKIENAKSKEDIEKFFDVETFTKWQVIKYLFGTWDHVTNNHNMFLYKSHNDTTNEDKWIPMVYDFDNDFGAYREGDPTYNYDYAVYSMDINNPLVNILNLKESNPEVIQQISTIMKTVFNPKILLPHIDELIEFLSPHIKDDRTNRYGRIKRINPKVENYFTYQDFIDNSAYNSMHIIRYDKEDYITGLKRYIIEKFKFTCKNYNLDCSYAKEYLGDPTYTVDIIDHKEQYTGCHNTDYDCCVFSYTPFQMEYHDLEWGNELNDWCILTPPPEKCWSLELGYPCCTKKDTKLYYYSKSAQNWYGMEDGEWCGITSLQLKNQQDCWSMALAEPYPCCIEKDTKPTYFSRSVNNWYGMEIDNVWCGITELQLCYNEWGYKCCKGCEEYSPGWGIEDNAWCAIPVTCSQN